MECSYTIYYKKIDLTLLPNVHCVHTKFYSLIGSIDLIIRKDIIYNPYIYVFIVHVTEASVWFRQFSTLHTKSWSKSHLVGHLGC